MSAFLLLHAKWCWTLGGQHPTHSKGALSLVDHIHFILMLVKLFDVFKSLNGFPVRVVFDLQVPKII